MKNVFGERCIRRLALACALGAACMPATAFKPAYEAHGHTMITRSVLSAGGYRFGKINGNWLTVPRFTYQLSTSSLPLTIDPGQDVIEHIVAGVQSRDLGYFSDGTSSCSLSDLASYGFFGNSSYRNTRRFVFPAVGESETSITICSTVDLDEADAHFDNDNFLGSLTSIRQHLELALTSASAAVALEQTDPAGSTRAVVGARMMLGKAIHTIQDFYAHSNWVERSVGLTEATFIANYLRDGSLPFSDRMNLAAQVKRKSGRPFPQDQGAGLANGDACGARKQDEFSFQTWLSNDGNWDTGSNTTTAIATGAWWDDLSESSGLTAAASDSAGAVRCDHGVSRDTENHELGSGFGTFSGIAKDMPGWPPSPMPRGRVSGAAAPFAGPIFVPPNGGPPVQTWIRFDESYGDTAWFDKCGEQCVWPDGRPPDAKGRAAADATDLHLRASYLAARHTLTLLDSFVWFVRSSAATPEDADRILAKIFGSVARPQTTSWVIDTSGTMADVWPIAKATIEGLMDGQQRYVLVDFRGGGTAQAAPEITVTKGTATSIANRLSQISPSGGSQCTSPVWTAVNAAVAASYRGARIVVISDASASDANIEAEITAAAQAKGIRIDKHITGSCSPLDPSYEAGAQKTGGSLSIIEHSGDALSAALSAGAASALTMRVVHTEASTISGTKAVSFPIESGVASLSISVSGSLDSVAVNNPSGAVVLPGTAGAIVSQALNGWTYAIANPQQGNWQVSFNGAGSYSVNAYVNATIDFDKFESNSVVHVGRPGHEYRPTLSPTAQTGRVWMKAHIVGGQSPVSLDLMRLDGSVINSFALAQTAADYFEGEVQLPAEAHRFRVRGLATDGTAFARVHGQGNVAPAVAAPGRVAASQGTTPTWRAGTVNAFAINLKNLGGNDTVSFSAGTMPTEATLTCNPTSIAVPGSEQVNVLCSIYLPEAPDRPDFSVVVSSTTATPAVAQTVTIPLTPLKLPLSCALDIDGDNRVDPAVDGVLLTRYLLGFRGAALTNGLTIPGPRKTDALLSAFFGNAAQFDLVGRASPAPTATVDGLLMTRLMLGYDDSSLLNGISIPSGAQFTTATAIKDNVVAKCAGGF